MTRERRFSPLSSASTLLDLVHARAGDQPEQRAYTFLLDGEEEEAHLTHDQLDRRARAIGAALQGIEANATRAVLLYPPSLDYVEAFFGCLYGGVVAVPAYPPDPAALQRTLPRLQAIIADARPAVVLTTSSLLAMARALFALAPELKDLHWLATDDLDLDSAAQWRDPDVSDDGLAFLQYTSGSTNTPKGVMLSHRNLLHNSERIYHSFGHSSHSKGVIWLPPYHDMGLIGGIIQPLYGGFPVVLMSPLHFLQRPLRWLRAVSHHGATTSGGPNFAYDLCVRKITAEERESLDLSRWDLAFNGAEPVRAETLDRFARAFAPSGFRREAFYPCYGLAEATLIVAGGEKPAAPMVHSFDSEALTERRASSRDSHDASRDSQAVSTFVACGHTMDGQELVIVDPDTEELCEPGQIGEIWLSGPSVAQGYWNREQDTESTFRATIGDSDGECYLRTGDLGFLYHGQLFVAGRKKDLIIIRGRNYYPQDIERTAEQSHRALRPGCGAAFSADLDGEEKLVIVYELDTRQEPDGDRVAAAIRHSVVDVHDLGAHAIVVVEPKSIVKTSSGKIQRYACRAEYLAGTLRVVGQWPASAGDAIDRRGPGQPRPGATEGAISAEQAVPGTISRSEAHIRSWLVSRVASQLNIEPSRIDVRHPLAHYGLSSVQSVSLTGELETWLGRRLEPTLVYEYPTIERLAHHLSRGVSSRGHGVSALATLDGPSDRRGGGQSHGRQNRRPAGEPIAIVGIGCRFPAAEGPDAFWQLLRGGVDAIAEIPLQRESLRRAVSESNGRSARRWGGFLHSIDQFDALFFKISPREAMSMDPQQRLLLEVAWQALADAGQVPEQLSGTRTAVFVGISGNDYSRLQSPDAIAQNYYTATGNALSIAANRLSYALDVHGPSVAVDTACSSSLVAVHLACQSLRNGESSVAIAGGVNIILSPTLTASLDNAGFLAPDGRCKAFDARADGYVRGEGAGAVILKPLASALAAGDRIYAVIRGSAVNSDGRSNGLTAPSVHGQEAVLRQAYGQADISPGQVQYIETHGTGTAVGDPIEIKALGRVLTLGRQPGSICALGSVKTNIGHLEAAAGMAGLVKTALALHHGEIPPTVHFQQPNPHIPFDRLALRVQCEIGRFAERAEPAIAGVSSFGFGGTNAHVVLAQSPAPRRLESTTIGANTATTISAGSPESPLLLPLSAHSPDALRSLAWAYIEFLPDSDATLADICRAAAMRRSHHDYRLARVARNKEEMVAFLADFASGGDVPERIRWAGRPVFRSDDHHRGGAGLAFVFSGQGAQWWGMGRDLLDREPVFRAAVEQCDRAVAEYETDWSLLGELCTDQSRSRLAETAVAQPVLFGLQVALAALWQHWGITPDAVVGHSMGEVAAAHVAGALSLSEAVRVIVHRGRLMQRATGQGAMAQVGLSQAGAEDAIAAHADTLFVGAINGPAETVLSGDPQALATVLESLEKRRVDCRKLAGDHAFHSADMEPLQNELAEALAGLVPRTASVPLYSTMTGAVADGSELDADYWARQIRQPVRFAAAVYDLIEAGTDRFIEIGAHPVLVHSTRQCLGARERDGVVLPSLRRGKESSSTLFVSLAGLYQSGHEVDWQGVYGGGARHVALPSVPWQRQRYWLNGDSGADGDSGESGSSRPDAMAGSPEVQEAHPLLGRSVELAHRQDDRVWQNAIDNCRLPYLRDHRFDGAQVVPATVYLEMALAAARQMCGDRGHQLGEVEIHSPMFLHDDAPRITQFVLSRRADDDYTFEIFGRPQAGEKDWTLHARGTIASAASGRLAEPAVDLEAVRARCSHENSQSSHYQLLLQRGFEYGSSFQGVEQVWCGDGEALARVTLPPNVQDQPERTKKSAAYCFHPAFMDACAQILAVPEGDNDRPFLPVGAAQVRFYRAPGPRMWSWIRFADGADDESKHVRSYDMLMVDEGGRPVLEILGLRVRYLDRALARVDGDTFDEWLYRIDWDVKAQLRRLPQVAEPGMWFLFADRAGVSSRLAEQLAQSGDRCIEIVPGLDYQRHGDDRFELDPARPDDIGRVFDEVMADYRQPCRGVVHLWGLDALPPQDSNVAALEREQALGSNTVLYLIQQITSRMWRALPRLWIITRGAQVAGDTPLPPTVSPATLWGLGRTIALEHPDLLGGLIDLDPRIDHAPSRPDDSREVDPARSDPAKNRPQNGREARLLYWEIKTPDGENQVAFRQGKRHVARLRRDRDVAGQGRVPNSSSRASSRAARRPRLRCRPDGSYLVTGGLGGLGLIVAEELARNGARRVILMGRTGLPARTEWSQVEQGSRVAAQIAAIRQLESLGVSVHIAAVDVGDEDQLSPFLDQFRREGWPPIRGVVHLAGVLQDQILLRLDSRMLAAVFRAKVIGAWLLHQLLDDDLDFFAGFSSIASVMGSAGQGNYAAANAFVDALAHYRRAVGKKATSINWGPWAEVGLATGAERGQRLARGGIYSIEPTRGLALWQRLLGQDATQVTAMSVDWATLFRTHPTLSRSPLLSDLAGAEAEPGAAGRVDKSGAARASVLSAAPKERLPLLIGLLSGQIARAVGLPSSQIDPEQPLSNLGIDSLLGIELKSRLEAEFAVTIPMGKLLEGPAITELAGALLGQMTASATGSPAADNRARATPIERAPSRPTVTALRQTGSNPGFFCVHPGALDVDCYAGLSRHLGPEQPFYAVQLAELEESYRVADSTEPSVHTSVDGLARWSIEVIETVQPHGPYLLGGWSLGGVVAFEIARQLQRRGDRVGLLALFDSPTPLIDERPDDADDAALVLAFASYLGARRGRIFPLPNGESRSPGIDRQFADILQRAKQAGFLPANTDLAQMRSLFDVYKTGLRHSIRHLVGYQPHIYPDPVVYFRASDVLQSYAEVFPDSTSDWTQCTSQPLIVCDVPGDHYTMLLEPNVENLARQLEQRLGAERRVVPPRVGTIERNSPW